MPALPLAESCVMGTVAIVGSRSMLQAPVRPVPGAGEPAATAGKLVTANGAAAITTAIAICPIRFLSILSSYQLSGMSERARRVGVRITSSSSARPSFSWSGTDRHLNDWLQRSGPRGLGTQSCEHCLMVGRVQSPALEDEREGTGVTGDRHHGDAKTRERRNGRGADRWLTAR